MSRRRRIVGVAAAAVLAAPVPAGTARAAENCELRAAAGDPAAAVDGQAGAGAVQVWCGDRWLSVRQGAAGLDDRPEAGDRFGASVAVADIDRDGADDLVVGAPGENDGAGAVHVVFGPGRDGQPAPITLRQGGGGVPDRSEAGDGYGSAVAAMGGTVLVGAPGEDLGDNEAKADAGAVHVVSIDDGRVGGVTELTQDRQDFDGTVEAGDRFGASLAAGSFDKPTAVIGVPGEDVSDKKDAGMIHIVEDPVVAIEETGIGQDSAGVSGASEPGDRFGASVAAAWDPSLPVRVAAGAPGEDLGDAADAGMVTVLGYDGRQATEVLAVHQNTAGVPGANEDGDGFGASVAAGAVESASLPGPELSVAIGAPGEDVGDLADAGRVHGVQVGAFPRVDGAISQETDGLGEEPRAGARFGAALAFGPGAAHVVVGAPGHAGKGAAHGIPWRALFGTAVVADNWFAGRDGVPDGSAFGSSVASDPAG
ncbi:integrin alpha [Actinomadura madurae]|uniref:FG-GAP repeat-containing protein n=1 Tax=Actinomadura madurae TaxID=1993 RepID=A0A1I5HFS1_9ACTN|nr:FG-GAP repeat protein [Actinomadura madurae]SFO47105.1 FG-GAP repeat-containing protein [Actinomadura madurae]SPT57729.1 FG-GAP repeat [Actinomadura madurae]